MRAFFIVGVKLIGLFVLYRALEAIGWVISSVSVLWVPPSTLPGFDPLWNLIGSVVFFLATGGLALFLLLRGERLASLVPLPELPAAQVIAPELLLRVGVVLAGLLVASNAVPQFVAEAFSSASSPSPEPSSSFVTSGQSHLLESGIQVFLSWLLIFRSARVVHWISGHVDEAVDRDDG